MQPWEMTSSRGSAFRIIDPLWRETIGHRLPPKGPTMRSFDVIFVVSLGKLLNNQSRCRRFETPRHHVKALWRYHNQTQASLVHYNDVIMSTITSQITSLTIVYSTVYSGADQRKHQSSASLAFVRGMEPLMRHVPQGTMSVLAWYTVIDFPS